jgi:hypothetical protein
MSRIGVDVQARVRKFQIDSEDKAPLIADCAYSAG